MVLLSQRFVFRQVHGLPHSFSTLWVSHPFLNAAIHIQREMRHQVTHKLHDPINIFAYGSLLE